MIEHPYWRLCKGYKRDRFDTSSAGYLAILAAFLVWGLFAILYRLLT